MTIQSIMGSVAVRAFHHRNFRLFFGGQAVSLVGSWMQSVAQAWLVLTLTNDPLILGIVAAAQWTPVLFLGLFGGLIADALPKRWTLVVCESTLAALALILGVLTLTGTVQVWMITVLAVLLGCVNAIEMPVRQAFAVEMVGREDVVNAVILNSAIFNAARVVGPAVAGLTIAATSTGSAFLVNAASFLAVIIGLLMMRDSELHSPPPMRRPHTVREVVASVGEGVSYVRRTPVVLYSVVVVGLAATIGMNFQVTIPPFAKATLGGDAADFGFLMTATGLGSVAAALWLGASWIAPKPMADDFDVRSFSRLPVLVGGRVKPLDTVARNSLLIMRGKQTLRTKDIWYTAVSGIWQTVWLEVVPQTFIERLKLTPDIDAGTLAIVIGVNGAASGLHVRLEAFDQTAASV
jgi:MFS family permease